MSELLTDVENDYKANGLKSLTELKARIKKHVKPFFGSRKAVTITSAEIRAVHRYASEWRYRKKYQASQECDN